MSGGLFIAGSGKDAGKTTLCLGLARALGPLIEGGVSFFKPLGQKITIIDGVSVGQDSWFISRALGLPIAQGESTPVLASRGAAERFVRTGEPRGLPDAVRRSYREHRRSSGLVLVEGTGHPGVGSVFELGNARVASLLEIPVILVLDGGVGSTIDSFCLCQAVFKAQGVPLLGVVINRVQPEKMDSVAPVLRLWFASKGVPIFGILPFEERIARPSVATLAREIGALSLNGSGEAKDTGGAGFITAFDSSEEVLKRVGQDAGKAMLVSNTRPDVIDAVIVSRISGGACPSAVIVCGGEPDLRRQSACLTAGIPLFCTRTTLEGSAARLSRSLFKIEPEESGKISAIIEMVAGAIDPEAILRALRGGEGSKGRESRKGVIGFLKRLFRRG